MPTSAKAIVVLVVEDEWILRQTIAEQLREAGHEVIESQTAEDAIGHARSGRVQVVFTDIQLPGQLSGWDVAEQFRAAQADVGIIYTSGNAADRSRQLADSAFFEKPYDPAAVVAACKNTQAAARSGCGHYYLHIRDGDGRLVDPEGAIFVNLDAAKAEAVESARELISQCVLSGKPMGLHRSFEIADAMGRTVAIVPFSDAIAFDR